ncbi:MAG: hypothetical protein R3359_12010 [Marinirhabdus sp.]|nr:hypothetical protein [Marinirhabdus sp.]
MHKITLILLALSIIGCGNSKEENDKTLSSWTYDYQAISKLGDTLYSAPPTEELLEKYEAKKQAYEENPNLENTIWFGRFTAYAGDYREAIAIYTRGLERFPDEPRLLRHRGHRYITVREFINAIQDLEKARDLIQGTENKIEEDGMPNAENIPVSTMHGNIYYHLGLAYYLSNMDAKAVEVYKECLRTSNNADNVVSATHWIYTINCQMGRKSTGQNYVKPITADMHVIENDAYHKACLLYKGELQANELLKKPEDSPSNSALEYGVANYLLCEGDSANARRILEDIVSGSDWASFGYIAAEVDLATKFSKKKS